jgi:hypothetical protein
MERGENGPISLSLSLNLSPFVGDQSGRNT